MPAIIGEMITIIIMAFALGMDAFSISLGMGMYKLRLRQIFKIGITIGVFHIVMPLLGMITGRFLSEQFGAIAAYIGGGFNAPFRFANDMVKLWQRRRELDDTGWNGFIFVCPKCEP